MRAISVFLRDIDLFPFYYLNDRQYTTIVGGICTLVYGCAVLAYGVYVAFPLGNPVYSSEVENTFDNNDEHGNSLPCSLLIKPNGNQYYTV